MTSLLNDLVGLLDVAGGDERLMNAVSSWLVAAGMWGMSRTTTKEGSEAFESLEAVMVFGCICGVFGVIDGNRESGNAGLEWGQTGQSGQACLTD